MKTLFSSGKNTVSKTEEERMDAVELWEKAKSLLKGEISEVSYNTFIKTLTVVELEGNMLVLRTPAEYLKSVIVTHYVDKMESHLSTIAGYPVKVDIATSREAESKVQPPMPGTPDLNPKYTFDTFIVGNGNRFAHAAAEGVARAPGTAYNPLFIYGGVGLGKTHLMHAIGHYVRQQNPEARLLYITSENFTNELISAIQQNRNQQFRERFRNVDILMVDDIQFIAGRDSTQEEFFHTFNALHAAGKQIIMTSDKPPKDIARLEERLCSRFEGGLLADIKRPDVETRIAILRKKAEAELMQIDDSVLQLIAERVDSNIRELEGCLMRLQAYSNLVGKPITSALCEDALKEVFAKTQPRRLTSEVVIEVVSEYFGLVPEDLTGNSRRREVATPRHIAMYLTREMVGLSLPQIGFAFGGRDHSTVLHGCKTIEKGVETTPSTAKMVEDIRRLIRESR